MGKRKSRKIIHKKPVLKLDHEFNCPFCSNSKTINIKINQKTKIANLWCRVCSAHYTSPVNRLSEPIDIYSEWIDACLAANTENADELPEISDKPASPPSASNIESNKPNHGYKPNTKKKGIMEAKKANYPPPDKYSVSENFEPFPKKLKKGLFRDEDTEEFDKFLDDDNNDFLNDSGDDDLFFSRNNDKQIETEHLLKIDSNETAFPSSMPFSHGGKVRKEDYISLENGITDTREDFVEEDLKNLEQEPLEEILDDDLEEFLKDQKNIKNCSSESPEEDFENISSEDQKNALESNLKNARGKDLKTPLEKKLENPRAESLQQNPEGQPLERDSEEFSAEDLEKTLGEELEDSLEDEMEELLGHELKKPVEDGLEDSLEDELEEPLEDDLEDFLEDELEELLEGELEELIENDLEEPLED